MTECRINIATYFVGKIQMQMFYWVFNECDYSWSKILQDAFFFLRDMPGHLQVYWL